MDIPLDLNTTQTQQIEKQNFNQTGGLLHEKLVDRYKVVFTPPKETDSFENLFKYIDGYGMFRFGFIHKSTDSAKNSAAVGGKFGIKSPKYEGVSFNLCAYVSQNLHLIDEQKEVYDFLRADGSSYAYLAEASLNYEQNGIHMMLGRFGVDMPYANKDDIRMSPNTFEGAWAHIKYDTHYYSQFFFISRWAGFDSQDVATGASQDEFKSFVPGGYGMVGGSFGYRFDENDEVSVWYHHIDKLTDIIYSELNAVIYFDEKLHLNYGLQFASMREKENSNIDGDVYGAMLMLHTGSIFVPVSFNLARIQNGASITDGYGGGPYFTSLDEATIAYASELIPGEDIYAYKVGIGYEYKENVVLEYDYGYMYGNIDKLKEHNLIGSYVYKNTKSEIIYAKYESIDKKMDRFTVRFDYSF